MKKILAIFDFCETIVDRQSISPFLELARKANSAYRSPSSYKQRLLRKGARIIYKALLSGDSALLKKHRLSPNASLVLRDKSWISAPRFVDRPQVLSSLRGLKTSEAVQGEAAAGFFSKNPRFLCHREPMKSAWRSTNPRKRILARKWIATPLLPQRLAMTAKIALVKKWILVILPFLLPQKLWIAAPCLAARLAMTEI